MKMDNSLDQLFNMKVHKTFRHIVLLILLNVSLSSNDKPRSKMSTTQINRDTFHLLPSSCAKLYTIFQDSKHKQAWYLNNCGARFIRASRLDDGNVLLFVSITERNESSKSIHINIKNMHELKFDFDPASLVLRVDKCDGKDKVAVSVSPLPNSNGLIQVNISKRMPGIGEHLLETYQISDRCQAHFTDLSAKCSLAESYLVLCATNGHSSCPVQIGHETNLIECNCMSFIHFIKVSQVLFGVLFAILIIALISLSLCCSIPKAEQGDKSGEESPYDKESHQNTEKRNEAYHYRVVFRVGYPTFNFDTSRSLIDFEILDSNLRPIGKQVRYALRGEDCATGLYPFTYNLYQAAPLPQVRAVRVSHTNGTSDSGLFLSDVLIKFIRAPSNVNLEKTPKNQKLKIVAYILDSPKIYVKNQKSSVKPSIIEPKYSDAFFKLLLWWVCTQTVCIAAFVLEHCFHKMEQIFKSFHMHMMLSMGISICFACAIALVQLPQLALFMMIQRCINRCAANKKQELDIRSYKSRQIEPESNLSWSNFFRAILCAGICVFIAHCCYSIYRWKRNWVRVCILECTFWLVLVLVVGISWLIYENCECMDTSDQRKKVEQHLMKECSLMALPEVTVSESRDPSSISRKRSITTTHTEEFDTGAETDQATDDDDD